MKPKAYRERMKQLEAEKAAAEAAASAAPAGGFVPTASLAAPPACGAFAAPLDPDPDDVLGVTSFTETEGGVETVVTADGSVAFEACVACGANPHLVPCPCGAAA